MMHVMAPDERRRRLASGADLHASERYDGAQRGHASLTVSFVPRKTSNVLTRSSAIVDKPRNAGL